MYLKRRIIIDPCGRPVKFAMVLYASESDYMNDIYNTSGNVIGYLYSYEKAERCENYFNEAVEKMEEKRSN